MGPGPFAFSFFKGALLVAGLMVMAYPVWRIVTLWLDNVLTAGEAFMYILGLFLLLFAMFVTWGTVVGWLLFLALVVACFALPLVMVSADKIALRRLENEDLERFTAAVTQQPKNIYAHERLARIYLGRRQWDAALAHVQAALAAHPTSPEFLTLQERIETERRRALTHAKVCPKCGAENAAEAGACMNCGFAFVDPGDLLRVLWTEPALLAAKWGGLASFVLGLALLFLLRGGRAIPALFILAGALGGFWHFYARMRERGDRAFFPHA